MSELDQASESTLRASRALLGVVAASLGPALDQVTLTQFRVLVLLSALGPTRSGELAERLGIHPSTFSRTTARLVAGAWVRRIENPASRREVLVDLTPKGRRLVTSVARRRAEAVRRILTTLTARQREDLIAALDLFAGAAHEPPYSDLAGLLGV